MKISIVIRGEDFAGEDLRLLLQGIRDADQKFSPEKQIFMVVSAPELTAQECVEILSSLKPPFEQQRTIVLGKEGIPRVSSSGKEKKDDAHNPES